MRRRLCSILCSLVMSALLSGCGFIVARSCTGILEQPPMYYEGVIVDYHMLRMLEREGFLISNVAMVPIVVDVALSGALETVWSPAVAVDRFLYFRNPPLVYLIEQGRHDELEMCLKSGANPDQVHRRHHSQTPILCSINRGDLRAFDLLVKHGAQVPRMRLTSPSYDSLEIASYVFENNLYELTPPPRNSQVHEWCVKLLGNVPATDNVDELEIILVKLLKSGYSLNPSGYHRPATVLDLVLMAPNLSQDVKDRLEKALRKAGAETYAEKVAKDPSLPHLDLKGKNVDPVFARFLHVLQCAECPEGILVTTASPGLPSDVPVLVVDFKSAKTELKSNRLTWVMGEATKSVQWTEGNETRSGKIPIGTRIIVAPDHVEIPSQVGEVPEWILQETCFKVPGFNILLLSHNRRAHPAIGMTIGRFALLEPKRYHQFFK